MTANNTRQMVIKLKELDMDFEFYPTTPSIIETIKQDYDKQGYKESPSVLDCGAGDGRVLNALTDGKKYAIEKAKPLLNALDKDIFVVGTEFEEQTLIDKRCALIFSNPPYSQFEMWATKIIKEANAGLVYLVIPSRWKDSLDIKHAIELREAKTKVLGSFDFNNADRQARAHVDIIRVRLGYKGNWSSDRAKTDPFNVWFDEFFKFDIAKTEESKYDLDKRASETVSERLKQSLVKGTNIVSVLEELYQHDLEKLIKTYQGLSDVDTEILRQLEVNVEGVRAALSQKIEGLKDRYWSELFHNLNTITDKLTASSRERLLSKLTEHTHVDFTSSNAHAIVCWVIKQSNNFYDDQLISIVEKMTEQANVTNYKSNKKVYSDNEWRYNRMPEDLELYKLEYRIVLERAGGINTSGFSYDAVNGLTKRAAIFIDDLCTIATNLGYNTYGLNRASSYEWESNQQKIFEYRDIHTGQLETLFTVRAFKNGNLHFKFCQKYIMRLSIEFGRLKGWLKNSSDAAKELDIPEEEAVLSFGTNLKLTGKNVLALEFSEAA